MSTTAPARPSIRCGKCQGRHESTAQVRACYAGRNAQRNQPTTRMATEKQRAFIATLAQERDTQGIVILPDTVAAMTAQEASATITSLLALPRKDAQPAASAAAPKGYSVPAGHYAVPSATGNNDLDFFKVDRPTTGRWAGKVFVKTVVGGHPDYAVRGVLAVANILERIENAGVRDAAQRYGQEIGRCSRCNRHLTDETSRNLGIGPDCRTR